MKILKKFDKNKLDFKHSYYSKTNDINNEKLMVEISCNGKGINKINENTLRKLEQYMVISLDIRLLKWLLIGPQKANWSNADLGSHLKYDRVGSVYKRGLFYCLNHFLMQDNIKVSIEQVVLIK